MDPLDLHYPVVLILGTWPMGRQKGEPAGRGISATGQSAWSLVLLGVFGICPSFFFPLSSDPSHSNVVLVLASLLHPH
jgi:hypothetical protein